MKSNITIAPNIYVRENADVLSDEAFIAQVYGHRALGTLKTRLPKTHEFTRPQLEEMKQNIHCRLGKNKEHTYGKVLRGNSVVWSCRCENVPCHNYEKCMALPNALRIIRSGEVSDSVAGVQGESAETGFNYEDANFEPPHVAILLPILHDILVGGEESEEDSSTGVPAEPAAAESAALTGDTHATPQVPAVFAGTAEEFRESEDRRVLVICENKYEAGYFSTILYKNGVPHRVLGAEGYTLNRRIADMFWDFCGGEIDKEAFLMRASVRIGCEEFESLEFFEALFALCGTESDSAGDSRVLNITALAEKLNTLSDSISECILNMDDPYCPVTLSTLETLSVDDEYDDVMLLRGEVVEDAPAVTVGKFDIFTAVSELFGSPTAIIKKESVGGWMFARSVLGRPCRVGLDSYTGEAGRHCLNVELGLPGDVDGKSFLTEQTGDAICLQLYIAERIAEGDELTVEKHADGGYWFFHEGNALGEFPAAIIREVRSIEGFPDDFVGFSGLYVRNIVTCVSAGDALTLPERFRETGIWLGLDIAGYAKVNLS